MQRDSERRLYIALAGIMSGWAILVQRHELYVFVCSLLNVLAICETNVPPVKVMPHRYQVVLLDNALYICPFNRFDTG